MLKGQITTYSFCRDRASNVRCSKLETSQSFKDMSDNWNVTANKWLKFYIYRRLPKGLAKYDTMITYMCSAFWHVSI